MSHDRSELPQPLWRAVVPVVRQELGAVRQREAPVTGSKTSRSSRRSSAGPAMGLMLGAGGRWARARGWDMDDNYSDSHNRC